MDPTETESLQAHQIDVMDVPNRSNFGPELLVSLISILQPLDSHLRSSGQQTLIHFSGASLSHLRFEPAGCHKQLLVVEPVVASPTTSTQKEMSK